MFISACFALILSRCSAVSGVVIKDLFTASGNGGNRSVDAPASYWGPGIIVTNSNTTLVFAQADRKKEGHDSFIKMTKSLDAGLTWSDPVTLLEWGSPAVLYSRTTNTIFLFTGNNNKRSPFANASACALALQNLCNASKANTSACIACEKINSQALEKAKCSSAKKEKFCDSSPPPPPLPNPLPADCTTIMITSKDDGVTWTKPVALNVTNTLAPSYTGVALNHGIELRAPGSKYQGRLILAHRYDCEPNNPAFNKLYARAYILYSDNQGQSWKAGERLPEGNMCKHLFINKLAYSSYFFLFFFQNKVGQKVQPSN